MLRSTPFTVALATDDHYALPTATVVQSLAASAERGQPLAVEIVDGGMTAPVAARLGKALAGIARRAARREVGLTVSFHRPALEELGLAAQGRLSVTTFARLLLPKLLPHAERALYLDCDVLVFRDIAPLFELDLAGDPVAAVLNVNRPTIAEALPRHRQRSNNALDSDAPYMNSGVMVLDLQRWRSEHLADAVVEDLQRHLHLYQWLDQCGLNAVLHGRWRELPEEWNVQLGSEALRQAPPPLAHVAVVHFTSYRKPWEGNFLDAPCDPEALRPYREAWMRAARKSGWFSAPEWVQYSTRPVMERARRKLGRGVRLIRERA